MMANDRVRTGDLVANAEPQIFEEVFGEHWLEDWTKENKELVTTWDDRAADRTKVSLQTPQQELRPRKTPPETAQVKAASAVSDLNTINDILNRWDGGRTCFATYFPLP